VLLDIVLRVDRERRYKGLTSAERAEERRRALVRAGLELFGTIGFRKTTIENLCATAGVGPKAFYEHFQSREELLATVYTEAVLAVLTAQEEVLAAVPPDRVWERTRLGVEAVVHAMLDDPRRARIMTVEVIGVSDQIEELRRGVIHAFADRLEREADSVAGEGLLPQRDHSLLALASVGAITEVIADSILSADPPPVERIVEDITTLLLGIVALGRMSADDAAATGGGVRPEGQEGSSS
jgi:AcrR family transcriptional regulator